VRAAELRCHPYPSTCRSGERYVINLYALANQASTPPPSVRTAAGNANGSTQRTPQASEVVETIATAGPSLLLEFMRAIGNCFGRTLTPHGILDVPPRATRHPCRVVACKASVAPCLDYFSITAEPRSCCLAWWVLSPWSSSTPTPSGSHPPTTTGERVSIRKSAHGYMTTLTFHLDCRNQNPNPLVALRHLTIHTRREYGHVMVALPDF